jgi:hypothetical protein
MAALGQLVVSLAAETSQFRASMDRAAYQSQKTFKEISGFARSAGGMIATALGAGTFVGFIKSQIDAADALNKTSQKVGIATDELSKLQYAAKLSDVSTEDLSSNLIRLNKSIAETARGTGEAQNAFAAMGISVKNTDGSIKNTSQVLSEIASKFASYEDGANKSALATAIFGKSGAQLIPLLNQGASGIANMGKELERLGGVIMPEAAKRAEEFNDNITKIKTSVGAAGIEIANSLLPVLTKLSNEFLIVQKNGGTFFDLIKMGFRGGNYQEQLAEINMQLEKYGKFMTDADRESLIRQGNIIREAAATEALARANEDMSDALSRRLGPKSKKPGDPPEIPDLVIFEQNQKAIQRLRDEYSSLFLTKEQLLVQQLESNKATKEQIASATFLAETIKNENDQREKSKEKLEKYKDLLEEYTKLYDEGASAAQKLADEEARLESLRQRLINSGYDVVAVENLIAEARMNAMDKLMPVKQKTEINELTDAFKQMGSAIGTAFEDAIVSGGNLREILKGLEQDIIRILMRQLVTRRLESFVTDLATSVFPGKESGGPVMGNNAYIVGEKGPEVFVPSIAGNIVPATQTAQMLNGGSSQNITINISTPNADSFRASMGQTTAQVARMMSRARRNM